MMRIFQGLFPSARAFVIVRRGWKRCPQLGFCYSMWFSRSIDRSCTPKWRPIWGRPSFFVFYFFCVRRGRREWRLERSEGGPRSPWDDLDMRSRESRGQTVADARAGVSGREGLDLAVPPALRAPGHLISRIFSQLDCVDLLNCALVCKQWYKDSAELREGWKNEYLEAWNLYGLCIKRETHPPSSTCSIRGAHSWCP